MKKHVENDCPLTILPCQYRHVGCDEEVCMYTGSSLCSVCCSVSTTYLHMAVLIEGGNLTKSVTRSFQKIV